MQGLLASCHNLGRTTMTRFIITLGFNDDEVFTLHAVHPQHGAMLLRASERTVVRAVTYGSSPRPWTAMSTLTGTVFVHDPGSARRSLTRHLNGTLLAWRRLCFRRR